MTALWETPRPDPLLFPATKPARSHFAVMSGRSRAGLNLSIHAEAGEPPLSGDGLTPVVFLALGGLGAKLDVVRSFFVLLQFLAIIAALVP